MAPGVTLGAMRLSGVRFVRVFQWFAPVVLMFLIVGGRELLGAPTGWMTLTALVVSPVVIVAMYIPPIVVVFDRVAKAADSTRVFYDIASWRRGSDASVTISTFAIFLAFLGWVGTLTTAIIGTVLSRRRTP